MAARHPLSFPGTADGPDGAVNIANSPRCLGGAAWGCNGDGARAGNCGRADGWNCGSGTGADAATGVP